VVSGATGRFPNSFPNTLHRILQNLDRKLPVTPSTFSWLLEPMPQRARL
jgi:hypothetical protein